VIWAVRQFANSLIWLRGFFLGLLCRRVIDQAKGEIRRTLGEEMLRNRARFFACLTEAGFPPTGLGMIVVGDSDGDRARFVMACAYAADVLLAESEKISDRGVVVWLRNE
jgi:hypothetical protein